MITKLKKQFVLIAMSSITLVLVFLISFIDIFAYLDMVKNLDTRLQILYDNDGRFPDDFKDNLGMVPPALHFEDEPAKKDKPHTQNDNPLGFFYSRISDETPFDTRFFTVSLDENLDVISVNTGKIAAVSSKDASDYARELYSKNKKSGFYKNYKFITKQSDESILYIFVSSEREIRTFSYLIVASIVVLLLGLIFVYILVRLLTRIALRPVEESYAKQKRFITDASHEIKTPLAIIDANMEVIEMETGESEWTQSTRKQIKRLTDLTKKLIMLSRMDEEEYILEKEDFCISQALELTLESYETVLGNRQIQTDISELNYFGNQENMLQVFGLLMDNAVKYSPDEAIIKVSCQKKGKNIVIVFYNEVDNIQKGNLDVLLERFYRNDTSRNSKTGGFGIGLSVAKAIVENHGGQIHCESQDGKSLNISIIL